MAFPGDLSPSDDQVRDLDPISEPEEESSEGNEQVGEQPCLTEHSSAASSSTGSIPAPLSTNALPPEILNNANEQVPASQKPPKITPRGIRRTKPLRQKEGIFIQPWEFKFELLSELKVSHSNKSGLQKEKQPLRAKKKKAPTNRKNQAASSTFATVSDDAASSLTEVKSPPPGASTAGHRRQHGKLHTNRVEFLLKKYLQDPSDVLMNEKKKDVDNAEPAEEQVFSPASVATALVRPSPSFKKHPDNFQKRATKSIIQVKGEQDAALRALQHAPRQLYAKPVPLEVAAPRLEKPTTSVTTVPAEIVITSQKNNIERIGINLSPRGFISSKPVPPSTTEPRYALLVADSVLRKYGTANQTSAENCIKDTVNASSGGWQKLLIWHAQNEDQNDDQNEDENESSAHLQTVVQLPQRPQSARPRRGSQSPILSNNELSDIDEEDPDELNEYF